MAIKLAQGLKRVRQAESFCNCQQVIYPLFFIDTAPLSPYNFASAIDGF